MVSSATVLANPFTADLDKHWDIFDDYCIDCHNFDDNAGGLSFELYFPDAIASDAALWEKVIRKIRHQLNHIGKVLIEKICHIFFIGKIGERKFSIEGKEKSNRITAVKIRKRN